MNKNKIWPVGLTIFLTFMVVSSLAFVYYTKQLSFDLVTEEYYQEGLAYQKQIDRMNNASALTEQLDIELLNKNQLVLKFPDSIPTLNISGTTMFFRPDDGTLDFKTALRVDSTHNQLIDLSGLKRGNWKVKVFWTDGTLEYYNEEPVFVN